MKKMKLSTLEALILMLIVGCSSPPKGNISTIFVSDRVTPSGSVIGSGPANLSSAQIDIGKRLSAYVWSHYDFDESKLYETDVGTTVTSGDPNSSSLKVSYEFRDYPSESSYDHVIVVEGQYNRSAGIKAQATLFQWIGDHWVVYPSVSRPIQLGNGMSITPSVAAAYPEGSRGFSHVTPGTSFTIGEGTWILEAFFKHQFGLGGTTTSATYGGLGITLKF